MRGYVRVQLLNDGGSVQGMEFEMHADGIRANVEQVMGAEGAGSLVIETHDGGYAIIPTRNIQVVYLVPTKEEA